MRTKNLQRVVLMQAIIVLVKTHHAISEFVLVFKSGFSRLTGMVKSLTAEREFYSISKTFDSYELDRRTTSRQTFDKTTK